MPSRRIVTKHVAEQLAAGKNRGEVLRQLAAYLLKHRMVGQLDRVVADIERNLAALGTVQASVITARPLSDELRARVEAYVARVEGAKTVMLDESVEPDVLGGIIVETPNKRLDASIASQIKRLKNA